MDSLTLPNAEVQQIMNLVGGGSGLLAGSTFHLWKNTGVVVGRGTQLADFTESTFQGYGAIASLNPDSAWVDGLGRWHVTFPSQQWTTVAGFLETMTNTLTGPITVSGSLAVTVTAAGMTGSPRVVNVPVLAGDSNESLAEKVATALNADVDTGAFFTFTWANNVVTATAKVAAANDLTMNMAFATGTATGLVAAPTATITQNGAAPIAIDETAYGVYLTDAAGTQYRGAATFAAPVALNAPNQAVFAQPDLIYGS